MRLSVCHAPAGAQRHGLATVAVAMSLLVGASAPSALAGGTECPGSPSCPADLNGDGAVETADLSVLLAAWGPTRTGCGDFDGNAIVNAVDLAILLRSWGPCPELCPIDLDVDTDRDNTIDDDDETDEDKWTRDRGAFYLVNCDDDDKNGMADAAEYDADEAVVIIDTKINTGDTSDITELVVSAVPNLVTNQVVLKVANPDQIRAIHVFEEIAEGTEKFWGGPTETDTEVDITPYLSQTDPTVLGIEGLKYRLTAGGVVGFSPDMLFDGFVQFEIECRDLKSQIVMGSDDVLVKVAPWLALPNTLDAEHVFAREFDRGVPAFVGGWMLLATPNAKFIEDLSSNLPAGQPKTFTSDTQWAQDAVEIGFSRTPRSELRVAAYARHHGSDDDVDVVNDIGDALWRRTLLMGATPVAPNIGHYRNPREDADSGDYGGNIELLPPTPMHLLGRLCVGDTISAKKKQFFASQEAQPPFDVPTKWLNVGHIDEVVTFWKEAPMTVIVASPRLAYDTLGFGGGFEAPPATPESPAGSPGLGEPPPDWATFYSIGETAHGVADGGSPTTLVDMDANFLSPPIPWRFVRIYDGNGAGQIAHIISIPDSNTLVLGTVWDDFDITDPIIAPPTNPRSDGFAAAPLNAITYLTPVATEWHRGVVPDRTSQYVIVEDTHWWDAPSLSPLAGPVFPLNKTPATITRKEFDPTVVGSKGEKMKKLNLDAQKRVNLIRAGIKAAAGVAVTFIEVPVLYTGKLGVGDTIVNRTAVAWTPGAANILFANAKLFVAAQKGPRFQPMGGAETKPFDDIINAALGAGNVKYVEDFDHYHVLSGEVHCGTNVLRKTFAFLWWEKQPASVPNLP